MNPVTTGSLAAEAVEPCQVRKEAALRCLFRVPRTTWLVIGFMGAFSLTPQKQRPDRWAHPFSGLSWV